MSVSVLIRPWLAGRGCAQADPPFLSAVLGKIYGSDDYLCNGFGGAYPHSMLYLAPSSATDSAARPPSLQPHADRHMLVALW